MKEEIRQYHDSLVAKDNEGTKYYFDISAENTSSGMKISLVNIQQNPKKCKGADNFKSYVERAERAKYDILMVTEYGADGTTVINSLRFKLRENKKNNNSKYPQKVMPNNFGVQGLQGFEQQLGYLGFTNGLAGVISASAEKMANEDKLRRQEEEILTLRNKCNALETKCENFKSETERYKEQYKSIEDTMKEMKRDHKYEIRQLQQKNTVGALAMQGILGFAAKRTPLGGILNGILSGENDAEDIDDDDDENLNSPAPVPMVKLDNQSQEYLTAINSYISQCGPVEIQKLATIFQYITIPGKLDALVLHCQEDYANSQQN